MEIQFVEFVWIWNRQQGLDTPSHQRKISRWLQKQYEGNKRKALLMAFRSSGKSTITGLFCAWLLMKNSDLRILVMAADHSLAKKMVRNVKNIIERHPLTKGLKPEKLEQWASGQFTVKRKAELRDPSMMAKGLGANITGSRADIIICDDVEVPKTCDGALKRKTLRDKLNELDFVLIPGGMQLYIGTPHTYYSIYKKGDKDSFLKGFNRLEISLLDKKGKSQWPEKFTEEHIETVQRRAGPNKFASQMMLKPVNITDSRLNPDLLNFYDEELEFRQGNGIKELRLKGKRLMSASCWWDPAFGSPDKGDSSVVACVFTDEEGQYWLHGMEYVKVDGKDGDEASSQCRKIAAFIKKYSLPAVRLETNGIGKFLPGLLRKEFNLANMAVPVIEETSRKAKDMRIIDAFDAVLAARALNVHESIRETPFLMEMREWQAGANGKDDGLDAVSGCLLSEPVRLSSVRLKTAEKPDWTGGGRQFKADTDFNF